MSRRSIPTGSSRRLPQRRVLVQIATVTLALLPALRLLAGLLRVLLAQSPGLAPGLAAAGWGRVDALGGDPVEHLTHETGIWALRLLLASLAITPLRTLLGWRALAPLRRTLGLLAFFYATLHLSTYAILDQGPPSAAALARIAEDVTERPYITAGFAAFLILLPLAVTSTRGFVRRLGRRWTQLHRTVYVAAIAAVLHFLWLVKLDAREPLYYAGVLALLLIARLPLVRSLRQRAMQRPRSTSEAR